MIEKNVTKIRNPTSSDIENSPLQQGIESAQSSNAVAVHESHHKAETGLYSELNGTHPLCPQEETRPPVKKLIEREEICKND
jgi:hypothetical protein